MSQLTIAYFRGIAISQTDTSIVRSSKQRLSASGSVAQQGVMLRGSFWLMGSNHKGVIYKGKGRPIKSLLLPETLARSRASPIKRQRDAILVVEAMKGQQNCVLWRLKYSKLKNPTVSRQPCSQPPNRLNELRKPSTPNAVGASRMHHS